MKNNILKLIAAILLFLTWIALAYSNNPQFTEIIIYIKLALEALGVLHITGNPTSSPQKIVVPLPPKDGV